jgi:hypothetical protein
MGTVTSGATKQGADPVQRKRPGVIDWLQTVPGIVTAIAGLLAAVGAFYGGAQLSSGGATPQPAVTVTVPAPGHTVTVPAAATVTVTAGSTSRATQVPTASGTALPPGAVYLSARAPLQFDEQEYSGTTTEAPEQIGTTTYPDSVRFLCDDQDYTSSLVYDVAGFSALRLTIGVPNDATDAAGNSAAVQFLKDGGSTQLIPQVSVALDQAQTVTVPLTGTSQLELSCTASSSPGSGGMDIVLGNAALIR